MDLSQIEREDEKLMLEGFSWREAASIANELSNGIYTICHRVQMAEDIRSGEAGEIVPDPVAGKVICGDVPEQSDCRCVLEPHEPGVNHRCDSRKCNAEWTYDEAGAFVPVTFPLPVSYLFGRL